MAGILPQQTKKQMIKKVTIADVQFAKGINKWTNKEQVTMYMKTVAGGEAKLSAFITRENDPRLGWQPGEEKEIVIEQKGAYFNFRIPEKVDYIEAEVESLKLRVAALEKFIVKPI